MATQPVRIHEDTYRQVEGVARLLGRPPADLLARAWEAYQTTPEFEELFVTARKAFETGDLDHLIQQLNESADVWASRSAARVQGLRER